MKPSISTVDDYINLFSPNEQKLLIEIRTIISKTAPLAKETINYGMPTFQWNGNLIHFGLFKKHLGIYPGSTAIEHFQDDLRNYKTSKGAIQIPLDQQLPEVLITQIIQFNLDNLRDKKSPDWKRYASTWNQEIKKIQEILNTFPLKKTLKWGNEVYTYNNKNVVSYGGFKNHFALWFYDGVFINDTEKVLVSGSEGKTKSLRQWRFQRGQEIPEAKIRNYIEQAIQIVIDGKSLTPQPTAIKYADGLLKEAITENASLEKKFNELSQAKKNEYISYVNEAKQDKTKVNRIQKIIPLILDGNGLNDKYKKEKL
ncbi:hypothetical protein HP439_07490 [Sphingobacterium shayense]|uniref:DUF1801 domain-containing protein n=1 Tax=Sphingobacterium shayense TaxID=626343 RepID=UPI00155454E1|nr:DUF1801 domain-containing protein [Sphingobacterium shayense]NQD70559.1 hypothetical protein [Sphingobacterium shayense]